MAHGLKDWTRGVWQAMSFINLEDTPGTYSGQALKVVRVEAGEAGLEFAAETRDIPSGEIILFEKDTAVAGYTLLITKDDMVVYITKGSVAGGEAGGTDKSGGTWTQPDHVHGLTNHQHELPMHCEGGAIRHPQSNVFGTSTTSVNMIASSSTLSGETRAYALSAGVYDWSAHDETLGSATVNTWRPSGRNFTRQQRN